MADMATYTCAGCGREIQVPAELDTFSCVYCGEKMTAAQFLAPAPAAQSEEQAAADRAYVNEHIGECVSHYEDYYKHFTQKEYEQYFFDYQRGVRPIFEAMDRYICCYPAQREALIAEFATLFLDKREAYHQLDRRWAHKSSRERLLFDSKLTLAWFTVPAILNLELACGSDYVTELHRQYMLRYPNNVFLPGTYEEISAGFRKRKRFLFF